MTHDSRDHDPEDDAGGAVGAEEGAEHRDEERRQDHPDRVVDEDLGHADELRILAEQAIDRSDVPDDRQNSRIAAPTATQMPWRTVRRTERQSRGAERLRHQRGDGFGDAEAEAAAAR